jgi:hypothetical protein
MRLARRAYVGTQRHLIMELSVETIETRRLSHLEINAALHGPHTDPAILIEIAELKHKKRNSSDELRRQFVSGLDYQFLMDVVAAALIRYNVIAETMQNNDKSRANRQLIHDIWMVAITVLMFLVLLMLVYGRN